MTVCYNRGRAGQLHGSPRSHVVSISAENKPAVNTSQDKELRVYKPISDLLIFKEFARACGLHVLFSLLVVATQTYHLSEIKKDNIAEGFVTCPSVCVGRLVEPSWGEYSVTCEGEEYDSKADIQRRGSISAWIEILSVYGADTITEVICADFLIYEINYWVFKQF